MSAGTRMTRRIALAAMTLTISLTVPTAARAEAGPMKVYILAGQSNMQGKARASTLPAMAQDPETKALYDKIVDADGKPRVYKDVILSYLTSARGQPIKTSGPLGVGEGTFGPEVAFGITMYEHLNEPILIIKTAWGGKSLNTDFRPPSAGPYYPDPKKVKDRKGNRGIIPAARLIADKEKKTRVYYRNMIEYVNSVLADPGKYCPAYDPKQGYEIAGFVWFQGYNDIIDRVTYPGSADDRYKEYSRLMSLFIKDVRKDLKAPKMTFVIGVMGLGGITDGPFQKAQAAPAGMPEFKGNVAAVLTGKYWDRKLDELAKRKGKKETLTDEELKYLEGASNAGFHYLGSAKIYSRIGEAFANAVIELNKTK